PLESAHKLILNSLEPGLLFFRGATFGQEGPLAMVRVLDGQLVCLWPLLAPSRRPPPFPLIDRSALERHECFDRPSYRARYGRSSRRKCNPNRRCCTTARGISQRRAPRVGYGHAVVFLDPLGRSFTNSEDDSSLSAPLARRRLGGRSQRVRGHDSLS